MSKKKKLGELITDNKENAEKLDAADMKVASEKDKIEKKISKLILENKHTSNELDAAYKTIATQEKAIKKQAEALSRADKEKEKHKADLISAKKELAHKAELIILNKELTHQIEKRKQTALALEESNEKYSKAFQSSPYSITISSLKEGRFIEVNDAFTMIFGFTRKESLSNSTIGFDIWKDIEERNSVISDLLSGKDVEGKEFAFRKKNGEIMTGLFSARIININKESFLISSIDDITKSKQIELALNKSEKEFRNLAESMPQIVWITDADGMNTYFNQQWMDYTGLTLEESYGHGWNKPFHPDEQTMAWAAWQNATETNSVYSIESRLCSANGTYRWFLVRGVPLMDENGSILKWYGTCTDINELKLAEDELKESEKRFRITAENLTDVIYDWDIKDNIHWYGDIDGITGYQPGGFPRTLEGWAAIIHPEDKDRVTAALEDHIKHAAKYAVEYRVRKRDGEWRWWSARGIALRNDQDEPYKMMGSITDITEQKEIQNRIKFNSELLSHIGQSVIATDLQGNVIYWNKGAEEIYGWSSVEAIGQNIVLLTPSEQTKEEAIEIMKVLSEGNSWSGEFLVKRKDGSSFPADVTDAPIIDSDGTLKGIIGISNDISERKHSEETLQKLSSAIEQTADTILITDREGIIEYVNPAFIKLTGFSSEEVLGKTPRILKSGTRDQKYYEGMWNTILSGNVFRAEVANKKKNGDLYSEEKTISPIFDKNKNITHFVGTGVDITQRKLAEEALRESETMLLKSQEIGHLGSWEWDIVTNKIEWSAETFRIYGYQPNEIEADFEFVLKSISDESREEFNQSIEAALKGEKPYEMEYTFFTKNKDIREIYVKGDIKRDKEGNPLKMYGVVLDITERKRATKELIKAKEKAEASDRLKTAFMNNISHEIRTPLNGILGFAPFVIDPDISQEEKESMLEILNISGDRLINTVTDYMDISLIASGSMQAYPKPMNLSRIIEKVYVHFQKLCSLKNLELKMNIPLNYDNFMITSDKEILTKILNHLIDNAIKFTQNGFVEFGYIQKYDFGQKKVELFVKDTGQGIAQDAQARIFDAFMQENIASTRGHEGSGLGLSIAKGLTQLLGGKIVLESEKDKGTTVSIVLPCEDYTEAEAEPDNVELIKQSRAEKSSTILVAEDDDLNYLFIEAVLRDSKVKLINAVNGQEAVDLCHKHPEIDLVLMDIKMPVMNGIEATQQIKSFRKDLPIIAVTAFAQSGDENRFREAGCDDYISKPINKTQLTGLIKKHCYK